MNSTNTKEPSPGWTAAVAITPDVVEDGQCDVSVLENEATGWRWTSDGVEVPEYSMTDRVVSYAKLPVSVIAEDQARAAKAGPVADEALRGLGWRRTEDWTVTDNAMYASVEPA